MPLSRNGTKAIRHFVKDMPAMFKGKYSERVEDEVEDHLYLRELATKVKAGEEDLSIERFPATEKGRPLLMGSLMGQDLDHQVRAYLTSGVTS